MNNQLRINSYNCRGLNVFRKANSASNFTVKNVLMNTDILLLQEIWMYKQDLPYLNCFCPGFHGTGEATRDTRQQLYDGRPSGGVAILWRTEIEPYITEVKFGLDWLVGIKISVEDRNVILLSAYLPHQSHENEEEFLYKTGQLLSIIHDFDHANIIVAGDINAHVGPNPSQFGRQLISLCQDNDLVLTSSRLPANSFTYVSDSWGTTSWLDHCICTPSADSIVTDLKILYNMSTSDHIPIEFKLNIDNIIPEICINSSSEKITWDKLSQERLDQYWVNTYNLLNNLYIPNEALNCRNVNCTNRSHFEAINLYYNTIVGTIKTSSLVLQQRSTAAGSRNTARSRPGWNDHVKEVQRASIEAFQIWRESGMPTQGPIYEYKKSTHAQYKYAVRYIKNNEDLIIRNAMAEKLLSGNSKDFWGDVKKLNNTKSVSAANIEGVSGEVNIAQFWKAHYEQLFNCLDNARPANLNLNIQNDDGMTITEEEIKVAIKELKKNKAEGPDLISAEHLKNCHDSVIPMIANCFTSMLVHGELPKTMLDITLIPVVKDNKGNISSRDNYRPIAIATCMSKLLEMIILNRIEQYLSTEYNQFGYRKCLGTDSCIYLLKEVLSKFRNSNTNIFLAFLDASKAFDRINHNKLFNKLTEKGVPDYIVRIIAFWYKNQNISVRWGKSISEPFFCTNGVKQGGILSPHFFNLYMDNMSIKLNKCKIGCNIGDNLINHLMYADDLILISPSVKGLQRLLNECTLYGENNDIKFNPLKSKAMIIRSKAFKNVELPNFYLNHQILTEVTDIRYLGHIISNDCSDDLDIMRHCRYLYAVGNSLIRKFHMCSTQVKIKLFQTYCCNIYTGHLWINYKLSTINKAQVAYNTIFRKLLNVPRFSNGQSYSASELFVQNNVITFKALLRKTVHSFQSRIDSEQSSHTILLYIVRSNHKIRSKIWSFWRTLLATRPP